MVNAQKRTQQQEIGDVGEQQALDYLLQQGLILVQRNFLCKGGELDLIMQERDSLVFVEVRKRASSAYGGALASITLSKQRRLTIAAQVFLQTYRRMPKCRFDVVAIEGEKINWLKNVLN